MDDRERIENVIKMLSRATSDVVAKGSLEYDSYWRAVVDVTDAVEEYWRRKGICPEYGTERIVALISHIEKEIEKIS